MYSKKIQILKHFANQKLQGKIYSIIILIFQSENVSCKRKVISIDTPWKDICSMESAMAMAIPDAVMKSFMGSVGNANEGIEIPYTVKIESVQNNSTKRKRTED